MELAVIAKSCIRELALQVVTRPLAYRTDLTLKGVIAILPRNLQNTKLG